MNRTTVTKNAKRLALGLAALALAAAPSFAQTVDLCATTGTAEVTTGVLVPIWGYVLGSTCAPGDATLPNPVIRATVGVPLTVNLTNYLPENVSFFVPGVPADTATGAAGFFTTEAVASGGTASYTFTPDSGTYLYQSATERIRTHVPMGLSGALVVDEAPGCAYDDPDTPAPCDVSYSQDAVLVYSDIDPNLNADPANYGGARVSNNTMSVADEGFVRGWLPQHFLINGKSYPSTTDIEAAAGADVLLRFVNAGLETLVPTLDGGLYMSVVAEDGNLLPVAFSQYGLELQPGKTFDAIVGISATAPEGTSYPLYDRALNLTNGAATGGGMLTYLVVTVGAPIAVDDAYPATEDTLLDTAALLLPSVLANDLAAGGGGPIPGTYQAILVAGTSNGLLTLNPDGSFTYAPDLNFNGIDSFTYQAIDTAAGPDSNVATVTITVAPANDLPVAADDPGYVTDQDTMLSVTDPALGVLANDTDIDGDLLTPVLVTGVSNGVLVLYTDGTFDYTPNPGFFGIDTFTYMANDGTGNSNLATATITVNEVVTPPVVLYFSTFANTNPPGVAGTADDADIYSWDGTVFSRVVDATALGLAAGGVNVDGILFVDATHFYLSFTADGVTVPGVGAVQDEDIVYYDGTTWSVYFDGTTAAGIDGGLTAGDQDIDAFDIVGGIIYFSTFGNTNPPLVGGTADNADIYSATFNGTTWTFARVVDVTTLGLPGGANVDGLVFFDSTHFALSFAGITTTVPGPGAVQDEDIVYYNGTTWTTYFDGTTAGGGLTADGQDIDALSIIDLPANGAPVAVDDPSYLMNQDTSLAVAAPGVLGNDTDADLDVLTAVLATSPANGVVDCVSDPVTYDLCPDGSFSYTPNAGFSGVDTFTYMANDGIANSAPATVTITVNAVGPPPSVIYFSTAGNTNPPGVAGTADDADIYTWNWSAFARIFDASTAGVPGAANVDGLRLVDPTHFYLSFTGDVTLPVLGLVQDEDIVYYDAGLWSLYFDGTAAGLTAANQDIDAFEIVGSVLYFSTAGDTNPPGVGGTADNADIYAWNGAAFSRVVDVTTLGVPANANVDGLVFVDATHFNLSFGADGVTVPGIGAVQEEDIVNYNNGVWSLVFDGTAQGLTAGNQDLDAIDFGY